MTNLNLIEFSYLAAAALFILSLRWLNHPRTARRGVAAGVAGMAAAIVGTLLAPEIVGYKWITRRVRRRHRRRRAAVAGAADGGAAADGAVACLRRPGRGPGRHREILRSGCSKGS